MTEAVKTKHIALQYSDRKKAEIFFTKILLIPLNKTFTLSKDLTDDIFNINEQVTVDVYSNKNAYFEIFITKFNKKYSFEHTCIEVNNKEEFVERCKKYRIKPNFVKKGNKELLFIRDFSGNLFEIKEKLA
jgi:catechol 2,3-dioxygenase-like lactoylglutathione lyase family enzyme